jgi:hypothetical protein
VASELRWHVTGNNGENVIQASADMQADPWRIALLQAEAVGMAVGKQNHATADCRAHVVLRMASY